jgi:membrane-associated phospholipid phosphatase
MNDAWKWSISFVLTTLAVVVSYLWLDRPIALFAHDRLKQFNLFEHLTRIPEIVTPLVLLGFALIGLYALLGRPLRKLHMVAVLCAASVAMTEAIKFQLKFAFGRTWPETWVRNNPSFIRDHVYGFFPFHGGQGFSAFPSGHTAAVCAVMSVLWICYPRFRLLYAAAMAAVGLGLVGADFHFLSDVIAGGFLGVSIGWLTVTMWEIGQRGVRPRKDRPRTKPIPDFGPHQIPGEARGTAAKPTGDSPALRADVSRPPQPRRPSML